jgi:hypothetical protein
MQTGFDSVINEGTVIWSITESGELIVGPYSSSGALVLHEMLSDGAPVVAAGQAEIAGAGGCYIGMSISAYGGPIDLARAAFASFGVAFDRQSPE